jgi:hypothetical protein
MKEDTPTKDTLTADTPWLDVVYRLIAGWLG